MSKQVHVSLPSNSINDLPMTSLALELLTQLAPALHGLYRAITSTSYPWNLSQWERLVIELQPICSQEFVDRLNGLLNDILQQEDMDAEALLYIQTFLSRYASQGRPLCGFFMVCCVIEIEWTVLAQTLAPPSAIIKGYDKEAAAANKAWVSLMSSAAQKLDLGQSAKDCLRRTATYAMQCFTDLMLQIEEMDCEPSMDTYSWETMSESLVCTPGLKYQEANIRKKLATICSVASGELDEKLYTQLSLLLSSSSQVSDNLVQEAALKATTVFVQR